MTPAVTSIPPPAERTRSAGFAYLLLAMLLAAGGVGAWLWYSASLKADWRRIEADLAGHELAAAADQLECYLQRRPADANAWFLAGRTSRRLGRVADAERYLTRFQQLAGVTAASRLEWDLMRIQQGDLGETHTRLRRTIGPEHPDAPLVLEALARGYQVTGRLLVVVEACDLWISRQPDHPWPWLWRGGVFEQLGNFHEALANYQRALENAPASRDIRLALGELHLRGRQPAEAGEQFEDVLGRYPESDDARLGLAACRIEQGRAAEAVPLVDAVLAKGGEPPRALFLRGKAALAMRDAAEAERWLRRAVEKSPDDDEALHQLVLALRAGDKRAEADRLAGRLEALRKDLDRLNGLIRAVGRDPDSAALRTEAGEAALAVGRAADGVRWLLSALTCRGDHKAAHAALAAHFARTGDPRAEAHRRQANQP